MYYTEVLLLDVVFCSTGNDTKIYSVLLLNFGMKPVRLHK